MAASEARAAWQRMANRCIVQEDAKRAPKLACYPSSATKLFPDPTAGNAPHRSDQPASNFIPPSWNPSDLSPLPPDTKWWLHVQPNLGAAYDIEPLTIDPLTINQASKASSGQLVTGMNHETDLKTQDTREKEDLVDWKTVDQLTFRKSEKAMEPWWRIADEDELASFVAKKSLEHFENCDLPQPRKVHLYVDQFSCIDFLDDHMFHAGTCNPSLDRVIHGKHHLYSGSDQACSGKVMNMEVETDLERVDLLEALRRSQTRAREAEMAAHQAHIEKEHIVDLFFKQASSLFAYRQWVKMLQLESLFLRLKMKDPYSLSSWSSPLTGGPRSKKRSLKQLTCRFCKCAVALAVGVVGLVFGWTLGWLLPIF